MAAAIPGFTPTTLPSTTAGQGFGQMSGNDFIKVMLAQLQNQDPLDPSKSDQLLTQLSQIKSLESNDALTKNLDGLTLQQSIGAGGNLIGKSVTGIADSGDSITGTVTSVKVSNKNVYLELDSGKELQLSSVTGIAPNTTTPATPTPATPAAPAAPAATNPVTSVLNTLGLGGGATTN